MSLVAKSTRARAELVCCCIQRLAPYLPPRHQRGCLRIHTLSNCLASLHRSTTTGNVHPSIRPSVDPSVHPSIHPSIRSPIHHFHPALVGPDTPASVLAGQARVRSSTASIPPFLLLSGQVSSMQFQEHGTTIATFLVPRLLRRNRQLVAAAVTASCCHGCFCCLSRCPPLLPQCFFCGCNFSVAASAFPATLAHPTAAVVATCCCPAAAPAAPAAAAPAAAAAAAAAAPAAAPDAAAAALCLLLQRLDRRSIRLALKCINATVHNDIREEALVARPDLVTISSRSRHDLARRCSQDHTH